MHTVHRPMGSPAALSGQHVQSEIIHDIVCKGVLGWVFVLLLILQLHIIYIARKNTQCMPVFPCCRNISIMYFFLQRIWLESK